jgi:hypothetical protein
VNSDLNPVDPPRPYGNQVVYYTPCSEGQNISVDADLPGWITIDTINQRLVGAANTFHGTSPTSATAGAQAILDAFGVAHASCNQCAPAAADTVINLALVNIDRCTYMPSNNTLWMITYSTDVLIRINLNDNTFTTVSIPSMSQITDICYGETQDQIYVSYNVAGGVAHVRAVNPDGSMGLDLALSVIGFLGTSECNIAWDSINDRLLLAERTSTPTDDNLEIVDCATMTSLFVDYAGSEVYDCCFSVSTGDFWVTTRSASGAIKRVNPTSFAITNSAYAGRSAGSNQIYYTGAADRIVTRGPNAFGDVALVNPQTQTSVGELGTWGTSLQGAVWNECTEEVQIALNGDGIVCVNKDDASDIRQINVGDNAITSLAWAETQNQSFTAQLTDSAAVGVS